MGSTPASQGFNVIGHLSGNFGLAVAARNTVTALVERGFPVAVTDVEAGGGRSGQVTQFQHLERKRDKTPFSVNIFHMNPPDVGFLMTDRIRQFELCDRMNACVPFWELPRLPSGVWAPVLESCDAVLAPTRFVKSAVELSAPGARVIHYPQTAFVPDGILGDRARWALPAEATVFIVALDLGSDVERKNPWATIQAFSEAFEGDPSAHLVVKLNNAKMWSQFRPQLQRLEALIGTCGNITMVDEFLSYGDLLSLYASCDVMSSLHRSEGLGLHLIEAMALGKPVIATRFGGNLDFMCHDNSVLIDYTEIAVQSQHPAYAAAVVGDGQHWADPDVGQAAASMRRLADEPSLREALGDAARRTYLSNHRSYLEARVFDRLLGSWGQRDAEYPDHEARAERLAAQGKLGLYRLARRRTGQALRRLGLRKYAASH